MSNIIIRFNMSNIIFDPSYTGISDRATSNVTHIRRHPIAKDTIVNLTRLVI